MDQIPVDCEEKIYIAKTFIERGDSCLGVAQSIFNSNQYFFMYPAAYLCHLGIELILKGCLIWKKSEYPKTHDLTKIVNLIDFLIPSEDQKNLLRKIDTIYNSRYPLSMEEMNRSKGVKCNHRSY